MATTAKIAKDVKLEKARKAKTPKLQCRHRNRCWRCGRPRAFLRKKFRNLPASASASSPPSMARFAGVTKASW